MAAWSWRTCPCFSVSALTLSDHSSALCSTRRWRPRHRTLSGFPSVPGRASHHGLGARWVHCHPGHCQPAGRCPGTSRKSALIPSGSAHRWSRSRCRLGGKPRSSLLHPSRAGSLQGELVSTHKSSSAEKWLDCHLGGFCLNLKCPVLEMYVCFLCGIATGRGDSKGRQGGFIREELQIC